MNERSRILKLTARNVKRIQQVVIDEVGDIHEVRGDADQGKTSILDAIEATLSGMDKSMVRRGADAAELELVLTDATVKRIINAADGKDTLMVTDGNGKAVERAKDFLATICGRATFRPLAWVQLGGGEKKGQTERRRLQRDQLLEALDVSLDSQKVIEIIERDLGEDYVDAMDEVNLDDVTFDQHPFVVCKALEKAVYEFRKLKAAEADKAEEVLRNTPAPEIVAPKDDLETCRTKEAEATRKYHEAVAVWDSRDALKKRRATLAERVASDKEELPKASKLEKTREHYEDEQARLGAEISELKKQLAERQAAWDECRVKLADCDDLKRKIERHASDVAELQEIDAQLGDGGDRADLDGLNKAMAQRQALTRARELQDKHDAAAEAAERAGETVKQFKGLVELFRDGIPKQLLAEADLPVDGLSVDDETILIHGVPLHQLGTSKQIRLGVVIAHALNPRSAFVLVDGAESMGKADRVALAETAAELGLQLIMTFVDPDAEPGAGVTVMREGIAV